MNVLFFSPTAHGGHPAYVREVMTSIFNVGKNINLTLLTREDIDIDFTDVPYTIVKTIPKLKNKNFFKSRLGWIWNRLVLYFQQEKVLVNFCMKNSVDVVHIQEITPIFSIFSIIFLKYFLKIRIVITLHNVKPHRYPNLIPRIIIDNATALRTSLADNTLVHTEELKSLAINISKSKLQFKILVAPHGVWSYYKEQKLKIINDTKICRDGLFIFGSIRENKGIELLLQSLIILQSTGMEVKTTIAGQIDDKNYYDKKLNPLIRLLKEKNFPIYIEEGFITHDRVREIADKSQYIILPYINFSAQSGILFDALALGLPIITTPSHSVAEFVSKHQIGAVASTSSADALALTIKNELINYHGSKYIDTILHLKNVYSWKKHALVAITTYK